MPRDMRRPSTITINVVSGPAFLEVTPSPAVGLYSPGHAPHDLLVNPDVSRSRIACDALH